MMKKHIFVILFLFTWPLSACKSEPPQPTPTPTPTPVEYLKQAAEAMAQIESVQFTLKREGTPVILDPALGLQFVSSEGAYEAPDRVHASTKVELAGNILLLDMLWLPEGNYMSNPLTGTYIPLSLDITLDPVALFDDKVGISHIMVERVKEPVEVGLETLEGVETRHLRGTADAERLQGLTLASLSGTVTLDLWLDVMTSRIARVEITEENGDSTVLDFFAYDEPVTIPSPS